MAELRSCKYSDGLPAESKFMIMSSSIHGFLHNSQLLVYSEYRVVGTQSRWSRVTSRNMDRTPAILDGQRRRRSARRLRSGVSRTRSVRSWSSPRGLVRSGPRVDGTTTIFIHTARFNLSTRNIDKMRWRQQNDDLTAKNEFASLWGLGRCFLHNSRLRVYSP